MNDISGIMIDMDGTVYKGGEVIKGAPEFIERLKKKGIPFVFLTNNSASGRKHYLNKLKGMGFNVTIDNILTSATATFRYINKHRKNASVYPVGTHKFVEEAKEAGIRITDGDPDIVLLAFDTSITYEKMNKAYNFIKNGAEFIATHPDDLCPTEDGYDIDIGPFIRFFETMTGVSATVIGKPNELMIEMAAENMNVRKEGSVMIGDRLYTDIKMAADNNIRSILVFSGETKEEDLENSDIKPTMTAGSVDELFR